MKEAAAKLGWKLTVIDGKGSPASWVAGFNQAIALKPDGIAIFADAKSLQGPIRTATDKASLSLAFTPRRCQDRRRISICSSTSRRIRERSARRKPTGRSPTATARRVSWS